MGTLIQKTEITALEIYNPKPGTKAIEVRRKMVQMPEVAKALNSVEKYVFAASTKTPIAEIEDAKLVENLSLLFKRIAMDVGYNIPHNDDDWNYIQSRLLDVLRRYYADMTLSDIKMAFELSTMGELDEYLPKDRQGNPDKNHYQQFNADYFSKILKAYKKKQTDVIDKAYKALPKKDPNMIPYIERYYQKARRLRNRYIYLRYKYTGVAVFELSDEMFIYDWLVNVGIADAVEATEDDRKEAFSRYMQRVSRGMINQYTAFQVRRKGTESPEIDHTAFEVARKKEIIKAFDRMIAEEMQVDNYMKF